LLKISKCKVKEHIWEKKIKDSMNVQKEEKVEDSLELMIWGEDGTIVEDSFDTIQEQEQEQDDNEEKVSSIKFLYWLKIIKKMCTIFRKLTIVYYETGRVKK